MASTASSFQPTGRGLRRSFFMLCLTAAAASYGADDSYDFNDEFVRNMPGVKIDVSRYAKGNPVDPGIYTLDIYLNGRQLGRNTVRVIPDKDGTKACLSWDLVKSLAIKESVITDQQAERLRAAEECLSLEEVVKGSNATINSADMQLDIAIPQIYLARAARGYVSPAFWERGENAFTLNYTTNYYRAVRRDEESHSFYGRALAGFNINGWMLRHDGALSWQRQRNSELHHYDNINSYVQRDITAIRSRLLLGEGNTSGEIFDTLSFRGAQLSTVDQMWPDSQRGYAPEIHGVARSNAQVTVRQNGSKIFETTVPPGAFNINDLYPTGYGGDLDVTIKEADGSETRFTVPFAAITRLKRPGMTDYTLTGGVSRRENLVYTPALYQATLQHGISNSLTGYAGVQGSDNYQSLLLGGAFGLPIGAISLDISHAKTAYGGQTARGMSYRATYSKKLSLTNTNLTIAAWRFSTSGYYSYNDAIQINNHYKKNGNKKRSYLSRPKERFSVTASQNFGDSFGNLYLTGFAQNYWDNSAANTQFQLGYTHAYKQISYTFSANRLLYSTGGQDTQLSLDVSLPLGNIAKNYFTANAAHNKDGITTQTSVNGISGDHNQYNYNISASRDVDKRYSGSVSGQYRSPYSTLSLSHTQGSRYHTTSAGASGAVVALSDGMAFSAYQSKTYAVVKAADAGGAHVVGYPNIVLNKQGLALVPNLNPYRINELAIDPKGIDLDVELDATQQRVIPVEGAVVKLNYQTRKGKSLLIRARQADGNVLPYGASVQDEKGNKVSTVSQGGQIYLRLDKEINQLQVSWGDRSADRCQLNLDPDTLASSEKSALISVTVLCYGAQPQTVDYASTSAGTVGKQG